MPKKRKRKASKKQLAALKKGRAIRKKNLYKIKAKVLPLIKNFRQLIFIAYSAKEKKKNPNEEKEN